MVHGPRLASAAIAVLAIACALPSPAAAGDGGDPPGLHPGAIELGIAGTSTTVEGGSTAEVALRGGMFLGAWGRLFEGAIEPSYTHVRGLDVLGAETVVSWEGAPGGGALRPFVALSAGVRQEFLGSFREVRYPVGFGAGIRLLASATAGARLEYRYRRVLHDPIADYSEHQFRAGLSIFLRNGAAVRSAASPGR